jgi:hypothetical protein
MARTSTSSIRTLNQRTEDANMVTGGTKDFSPFYSAWLGKPVVLLVAIRHCHIPMPCRIVAETITEIRVLLSPGWELNVRKVLILALEEDSLDRDTLVN